MAKKTPFWYELSNEDLYNFCKLVYVVVTVAGDDSSAVWWQHEKNVSRQYPDSSKLWSCKRSGKWRTLSSFDRM